MTAIYYASVAEQRAVLWLKQQRHKGGAIPYALQEVAYDPYFTNVDWRDPPRGGFLDQRIPRKQWIKWRARPYGNSDMNRMHQLALRCIRRNTYFPWLARKMGRRNWAVLETGWRGQ